VSAGSLLVLSATISVVLYTMRLMIASLVRSSIDKGATICQGTCLQHDVAVIVGFSWGGAIVAELLANGTLFEQDHPPALLLLAPTSERVAQCGGTTDAVLRIPKSSHVAVVHASHDGAFCPHPERWQQIRGLEYSLLQDNHIFQRPDSQEVLVSIL
jgi:hypothetical protein